MFLGFEVSLFGYLFLNVFHLQFNLGKRKLFKSS